MSNYQQTTIVGESWLRAKRIVIENPYNDANTVKFVEEKVFQLGDKVLTEQSDTLNILVDSEEKMLEQVDIIDPSTGEPTGQTITFQEIYAILFSAYIEEAMKRDAPPVEETTEDPTDENAGGTA